MALSLCGKVALKTLTQQLAFARQTKDGWSLSLPKLVREGRMKESVAKEKIESMDAIIQTLEMLNDLEEVSEEMIRSAEGERKVAA